MLLLTLACCVLLAHARTRFDGLGDRLVRSAGIYEGLPLSRNEAVDEGWIVSETCVPELGFMAKEPGSKAAVSLYYNADGLVSGYGIDIKGEVAREAMQRGYYRAEGGGRYHMAVSFREEDPCRPGTDSSPVGRVVNVINWKTAKPWSVPLTAAEAKERGYLKGACIGKMGRHWGFDFTQRDGLLSWRSDNLFPVIPMYDVDGSITAILITSVANQNQLTSSRGWDIVPIPNPLMCLNFCSDECEWGPEHKFKFWSTHHLWMRDPETIECRNGRCGDSPTLRTRISDTWDTVKNAVSNYYDESALGKLSKKIGRR